MKRGKLSLPLALRVFPERGIWGEKTENHGAQTLSSGLLRRRRSQSSALVVPEGYFILFGRRFLAINELWDNLTLEDYPPTKG
jgi:hypothetical protein